MFEFLKSKPAKNAEAATANAEAAIAAATELHRAKQVEADAARADVDATLAAFQADPDNPLAWPAHEAAKRTHARALAVLAAADNAENIARGQVAEAQRLAAAEAIAALPVTFEDVVGPELIADAIKLGDQVADFAGRMRAQLATEDQRRKAATRLAEASGTPAPLAVDGGPQANAPAGPYVNQVAARVLGWWIASRLERGQPIPDFVRVEGRMDDQKAHQGAQLLVSALRVVGPFELMTRITERPLRAARAALGLKEPERARPFDPTRKLAGSAPNGWTMPGDREPLDPFGTVTPTTDTPELKEPLVPGPSGAPGVTNLGASIRRQNGRGTEDAA